MNMNRVLLWLVCLGFGSLGNASAEIRPASLFQDHMVLQRDMPVPVWGTADPGETVTVRIAGQTKTAVVDSSSHWKVTLDPMPASFEGAAMTISAGSETSGIQFDDVVVGDVWICSGQSNMQMGYGGIQELKDLESSAKNIRSFHVKNTVSFEEAETCGGTWKVEVPSSAVAFGFAYFLEEAIEAPVGIILTAWGSSSLEAWMPRDMTESVPHFKTMMDEFDADEETRQNIQRILDGPRPWKGGEDIFLRRQTNILYNAMMHPLAPYACRGLVWYQGERNTQSMAGMLKKPWFSRNSGMLIYGDVMKEWIKRYRQEWGNDDLHFLVVMLPGYFGKKLPTGPRAVDAESPDAHSWAWMRESQLQTLDLPHVSVANTIDLGDVKNVHPKDKLPVGKRLALLAQRDVLAMDVVAEGPVMQKVDRDGGELVVHFTNANGLKTTDGADPMGFWLADESQKWVRAEAKLDGNTVKLRSSELSSPLYVRYAFAGKPSVNLVNEAGLPARPFRSDDFQP
ncbi:sialate O-acetylesterase [Neorhodopirellula lusitana]|uniref:Sialate O-acetylesterase n=1 Tax=Neorhodopirellula lusitana TaxID=445327 RepID=A0ABY1PZ58_9BACT|nr:sialate O-acetylesterase [Neorhodopirellula lusitana]